MDDPLAFAAPRTQPQEANIATPAKAAPARMFLMAMTPKTNFNSRPIVEDTIALKTPSAATRSPRAEAPSPLSKRPAQQRGANRKSRAHRRQQHQASLLQLALFDRRVHGQRNRAGGGIPVLFDVDDHTLRSQAKAIGGGGDDAQVGLVGNESVNV